MDASSDNHILESRRSVKAPEGTIVDAALVESHTTVEIPECLSDEVTACTDVEATSISDNIDKIHV